ncbi:MAG TPA: UxaA family hydrolase [Dehalococcoidia bacterium]|nr:UxaA family hydrolase [Dehalococcoidia bacterium]
MELKEKAIVLNEKDNVATALADLEAGSTVELDADGKLLTVKVTERIPFGHKFSLTHIEQGGPVIKYGEVIGRATTAINAGDYVHVHNVVSTRGSTGAEGGAE